MTDQELDVMRLNLRFEVLKMMLSTAYTALGARDPHVRKSLLKAIELARKDGPKVHLRGLPAEYSDLIAAEFQEALEEVLSAIESGLK